MSDKNGKGTPVKAALCRNCGLAIGDPEVAFYDGEDWYCDPRCHGQHLRDLSGNVPA